MRFCIRPFWLLQRIFVDFTDRLNSACRRFGRCFHTELRGTAVRVHMSQPCYNKQDGVHGLVRGALPSSLRLGRPKEPLAVIQNHAGSTSRLIRAASPGGTDLYIYRERERHIYIYIYVNVCICIYLYMYAYRFHMWGLTQAGFRWKDVKHPCSWNSRGTQ